MGKKLEIAGQIFGNLKAIKNTGQKYQTNYIWEFECLLCGKIVKYPARWVTSGQCTSCGCSRLKNLKTMDISQKLGQVDGTNVSRILSGHVAKNNTSGHAGVSLHRQKNRSDAYVAYIYFKGIRYHLGSYRKKEDAINAREQAESELHKDFLGWYRQEFPDRWAKINKNNTGRAEEICD